MMEITITITNPDSSIIKPVLIEQPAFDEYLDRPRKLSAKIEKGSGADPQGTVQVTHRGKIIFLGHIRKYDQSNNEYDVLVLESAEALLDARIGQFYRYPAGKALNEILTSSIGGGSTVVGLLAMANGLIPRGSWTLHSGSVYKITGAGTSSRFGTLSQLYQDATLLTKHTAIPNANGKWYQDSTYLYIWCSDGRSPDYHLIVAPNFKDTLIRLGNISGGTSTFSVCFEIGASKIWPTIKALILAAGLEYNVRYEKDGYAYLDGVAAVGKGSESSPVATYIHGKNAEISVGGGDLYGGRLQALLGQGAGAGITQQCAASLDLSTPGTWREAVYQAGGLFGAMLRTATGKVFSDVQDPIIYNVRIPDQDWSQGVGNYVGVIRSGYQPIVRRIKHIQMRSAGDTVLEVGQRLRTLGELLKAGEEVQQILSSFYGAHTKNAWSWSLPETNIDSFEEIAHKFLLASTDDSKKDPDDKTIGSGEIDPNFPFMVLLNLRIDWFKSSTYSASTPASPHSNVGSHGGYGGGSTSAKTQTAHNVPGFTGQSSNDFHMCVDSLSSMTTSGSHAHSLSGSGSVSNAVASGGCGAGGSPAHVHSISCYYCSGVSISLSMGSAGGHVHNVSYSTVGVSPYSHVHPIPSHYTNDAGSQSHETTHETSQTRAGSSSHPEGLAVLEGLIKKYAVGNSIHYLTLRVRVNGTDVPGSSFTNLYIGDQISNIDISNLVTVGQQNTIILNVSEFGGSSTVRCSVSGNINVNAIISAF